MQGSGIKENARMHRDMFFINLNHFKVECHAFRAACLEQDSTADSRDERNSQMCLCTTCLNRKKMEMP